jgi:hypothetical protein
MLKTQEMISKLFFHSILSALLPLLNIIED